MNSEVTLPLLQLTPRPDLGVLVGRWGYQPDPAELPAAYEALTAAVARDHCRFWLQDIRRRSLNDPHITKWLLSDYFPGMARQLGGRLCVAYLVSPALHKTITDDPGFLPLAAYEDRPFALGFFGDEGAAIQWLQAQQRAATS
ncbi:hypothetical protein [Hymenobacter sp.]|uniref:hypothetical protein n=1 Tax=Hymenobacter sp. TaxID=1898978 RepID=UPI00286A2F24|nr:hypothetical protein [Hymenobacter sp.]